MLGRRATKGIRQKLRAGGAATGNKAERAGVDQKEATRG